MERTTPPGNDVPASYAPGGGTMAGNWDEKRSTPDLNGWCWLGEERAQTGGSISCDTPVRNRSLTTACACAGCLEACRTPAAVTRHYRWFL